jgi:Tat protein translocase TatB subunit
MFGTLGGPELFLIFVVALIVFGPRKLPDIGKSLGKMMSEFRRASNDFRSTIESEVESEKIRESMRIEPPKVKKVETTSSPAEPGTGSAPPSGTADSEASSESGDTSEDADSPTDTGASAEGSAADGESGTEGSATPGDTGPESGSGSDGEPVPSTVSRQPPPATEPK